MATERTVLVRLKANVDSFNKGMLEAAAAVKGLTHEIDSSSDRTAWLAQSILALAPAAVTLGAGAVPAIAGITTQMVVTGAAAGTMALAFHGVGKALTALNTYQLEPTAVHLTKLHEEMGKIGPQGAQFVHFLDSMGGQINDLANSARAGMFPGMEDGIRHLLTLLPRVQDIVGKIGSGIGELASEAGKGLAGSKFEAFFAWLDHTAKPILLDMGRTVGNLAEGLANMLVAFAPQSLGFSHGLLQMSRAFAEWSRTLDTNQSFQAFLDYVDKAGPKALDFLGSLIDTASALIQAWAPVGQVMLPMLTDLLDMIAKVLDTPLGPAILGLLALASAFGRLKAIAEITNSGVFNSFGKMSSGLVAQSAILTSSFSKVEEGQKRATYTAGQYVRAAGTVGIAAGALGLIATGTAGKLGMTNTASLTLAGTMAGPLGAAAGFAVGSFLDVKSAVSQAHDQIDALQKTSKSFDLSAVRKQMKEIEDSANNAPPLVSFLDTGWHGLTGGLDIHDQRIEAANKAFATMQKSGTALQQLFTDFNNGKADKFGQTWATTNKQLEQTATKARPAMKALGITVGDLRRAAVANDGSLQNLTGQIVDWTRTSGAAAKKQHQLKVATEAAKTAAQTTAAGFITLGKSLDDSKVSLNGWIRELAKEADDLVNFGNNARKAADHGLRDGLIKQLEAAGPAGALRMGQLANATQSQIKKANGAYLAGQRAIGSYTAAVTGIPDPTLDVNSDPAIRGINLVANAMRNLPSNKTITINTRHTGGHVSYDTGGYTGAGPKMEVAGVVHRGEVVLPQEIVDRDWAKLKAQYGYLPGFAGGGLVSGAQRANPGGGSQRQTVNLMVDEIPVRGTVDVNTGSFVGMAKVVATDVYHQQRDADDRHERAMNG